MFIIKGILDWLLQQQPLLTLGVIYYLLFNVPSLIFGFSESFAISERIFLYKALVLRLTIISLFVYYDSTKIAKSNLRMEFVTLALLSTVDVFVSISARDLILLFCVLELQVLSGCALAAFNFKAFNFKEFRSLEARLYSVLAYSCWWFNPSWHCVSLWI